jgi:hypothetical protein
MQRRKFLLVSALAATSAGVVLQGCHTRNPALERILEQPGFLARICEEKTILEIGKSYLEKRPAENNPGKLVDLLLTKKDGELFSLSSTAPSPVSFLEQKTKQDFSTGNTVILSGWILSTTEARQSALFFLNHPQ